jgi:hypothetical protein
MLCPRIAGSVYLPQFSVVFLNFAVYLYISYRAGAYFVLFLIVVSKLASNQNYR